MFRIVSKLPAHTISTVVNSCRPINAIKSLASSSSRLLQYSTSRSLLKSTDRNSSNSNQNTNTEFVDKIERVEKEEDLQGHWSSMERRVLNRRSRKKGNYYYLLLLSTNYFDYYQN